MMYLKYILILLHTVFRKTFGYVWCFVVIPFRKWSRNSMYNYLLSNGIYLERLLERPIIEESDKWIIQPYHGTEGEHIQKRKYKVTWLEYQFNLWFIWGWLDDDANHDTFDWHHCKNHIDSFPHKYVCADKFLGEQPFFGNAFDLGDKRAEYPAFKLFPAIIWNARNLAYNYKYFLFEMSEKEWNKQKPFFKVINGYCFGWVPFSEDVIDKGEQGRLVFMEDVTTVLKSAKN